MLNSTFFREALGTLWRCFGGALGTLWGHFGDAFGALQGHFGDALGMLTVETYKFRRFNLEIF